ncbi:MAG: beta-lactamase class D [Maribacter sp.]|jgi:beta-lactamase class D
MKIVSLAVFLMLCFSYKDKNRTVSKTKKKAENNTILKPKFQSIIDSYEVTGCILIYDLNEDTYYSNNFECSNKGNLPASTFKIVNSIIGLETDVIESGSTVFKWDGKKKWLKN